MQHESISKVICCRSHSLVLSTQSLVYSWGANSEGQLGYGDKGDQGFPIVIEKLIDVEIENIFCGYLRSFAVTKQGCLYQWGKDLSSVPQKHPFFDGMAPSSWVVDVACDTKWNLTGKSIWDCTHFTVYLTKDGSIWLVTSQQEKKTGTHQKPIDISYGYSFVQVAAGDTFILGLTPEGEVCGCGKSKSLEIGMTNSDAAFNENLLAFNWSKVPIPVPICKIVASVRVAYALDFNGTIWTWGGKMVPHKIPELQGFSFKDIACGNRGLLAVSGTPQITFNPAIVKAYTDQKLQMAEILGDKKYKLAFSLEKETFQIYHTRLPNLHHLSQRVIFAKKGSTEPIKNFPLYEFGETSGIIKIKTFPVFLTEPSYDIVYQILDDTKTWISVDSINFLVPKIMNIIPPDIIYCSADTIIKYEILYPIFIPDQPRSIATTQNQSVFREFSFEKEGGSFDVNLPLPGKYLIKAWNRYHQDQYVLQNEIVQIEVKSNIIPEDHVTFTTQEDLTAVPPKRSFKLQYEIRESKEHKLGYDYYTGLYLSKGQDTWPPTISSYNNIQVISLQKGSLMVNAPAEPGDYEYRIMHTFYKVRIKSLPFTVKKPEPVAVKAPLTTDPKPLKSKPKLAKPTPKPITALPYPSPQQNYTKSPWEEFFRSSGIPDLYHSVYCQMLEEYNIPISMLKNFDTHFLNRIGIASPEHQMLIMDKVNQAKEDSIVNKLLIALKNNKQ
uniref:SAM domain-containing protein n=1 Tax=Arcella intermedia TaxID=1963864 RepID=A0A6B2KYN0_9EUKA